jgi:hypothetical protein
MLYVMICSAITTTITTTQCLLPHAQYHHPMPSAKFVFLLWSPLTQWTYQHLLQPLNIGRCNMPLFFTLLYKNSAFLPIPSLSCVLASIANNKGTINPPAFQSLFPFLRSLPCSLSLYGTLARRVTSLACLRSLVPSLVVCYCLLLATAELCQSLLCPHQTLTLYFPNKKYFPTLNSLAPFLFP